MPTTRKLERKLRQEYDREYKGRPCICWLCGCICTTLLIILIILVIFVATFNLPTMKLNDTESGNPPYSLQGGTFTGNSINNGDLQQVTVNINYILNLEVDNPNFYGVNIDRLSINVYYRPNNLLLSQVNNTLVQIAPNSVTTQKIPVSIILQMTGSNANSYLEIMSKCGYLGGTKANLPLRYEIKIDTPPVNTFTIPVIKVDYDTSIY